MRVLAARKAQLAPGGFGAGAALAVARQQRGLCGERGPWG